MSSEGPVFGTLSLYQAMADALNSDPAWVEKGANITASMVYNYLPPIGRLFYLNFDHGKITGVRDYYNALTLMAQLGLMPEPAESTA